MAPCCRTASCSCLWEVFPPFPPPSTSPKARGSPPRSRYRPFARNKSPFSEGSCPGKTHQGFHSGPDQGCTQQVISSLPPAFPNRSTLLQRWLRVSGPKGKLLCFSLGMGFPANCLKLALCKQQRRLSGASATFRAGL